MLSDKYLQEVIEGKDQAAAVDEANTRQAVVCWAICDGAMVIYDYDDPPPWFKFERDEDGNSVEFDGAHLTVPGKV